jgi:hypothetical protein
MKTPVVTNATLLMLAATPALAMSCCGGKGAMMCGKGGMAMTHAGMTGKKGGGCCDGMASNMSKRG